MNTFSRICDLWCFMTFDMDKADSYTAPMLTTGSKQGQRAKLPEAQISTHL